MPDENPLKHPLLSYDKEGKLDSEVALLEAIDTYRQMSQSARQTRAGHNRENWDFYHGRQDWSHKMKHQSKDFMPDFPMAMERIALTFAQPFAETEDWFDVVNVGIGPAAFDPISERRILQFYLNRLFAPGDAVDTARPFSLVMYDAAKMASLEAIACFKVYAKLCNRFQYMLESGNAAAEAHVYESDYSSLDVVVQKVEVPTLRLAIDLIPWEDYFPDPTGHGLFDIHEKSVTLSQLRDNPDYDTDVIDELAQSRGGSGTVLGTTPEFEKRRRSDQDDAGNLAALPRIRECWGDIVDLRDGKMLRRNSLCTTTTGKRFLRPPVDHPMWHGRRIFVPIPLLPVPLSENHKAIADHAVPVARAMNELDNLMLDGAIGGVWGIRQVRSELLENPEEIDDGIPQGYTGKLKDGAPEGAKFLERIDDKGGVPAEAASMMVQKQTQFQTATALPDTAQGNLPKKDVTATETALVSQASQGLFGGLATFVEKRLNGVLELAWLTLWQYADDFMEPEIVQIIGPERALVLQSMSAAERFVMMAQSVRFDIKGLRQLAQSQEVFARLTTFLQSLGVNPALLMAFDSKYDVVPYLEDMMRAARLQPEKYEKKPGQGYSIDPVAAGVPQPDAGPAPAGGIASAQTPGDGTPGAPQGAPGTKGTGTIGSEIEKTITQTNPQGFRGGQL
jgi:hypothetical protein